MKRSDNRPLSALALKVYRECPLRFRYRYRDGLFWSKTWGSTADDRRALERGEHFHVMARRYYAGVDPARVTDPVEQEALHGWLRTLQDFLPRTFGRTYYPELELTLHKGDLDLMAKFDLVVVDPDGSATIFDWKTEGRPFDRSALHRSEQTLVYRYMLCEAGGAYSPRGRFQPEEITMIYWNPLFPHRWERLTYAEAEFLRDAGTLEQLAQRINATPDDGFGPTSEERVCRRCEFQMICHQRHLDGEAGTLEEDEFPGEPLSWDEIPDLP